MLMLRFLSRPGATRVYSRRAEKIRQLGPLSRSQPEILAAPVRERREALARRGDDMLAMLRDGTRRARASPTRRRTSFGRVSGSSPSRGEGRSRHGLDPFTDGC
jgi:hypothetical protein